MSLTSCLYGVQKQSLNPLRTTDIIVFSNIQFMIFFKRELITVDFLQYFI